MYPFFQNPARSRNWARNWATDICGEYQSYFTPRLAVLSPTENKNRLSIFVTYNLPGNSLSPLLALAASCRRPFFSGASSKSNHPENSNKDRNLSNWFANKIATNQHYLAFMSDFVLYTHNGTFMTAARGLTHTVCPAKRRHTCDCQVGDAPIFFGGGIPLSKTRLGQQVQIPHFNASAS